MVDPKHRHKFGYDYLVEKEEIRERLIREGVTSEIELFFTVNREFEKAHANDAPYSVRVQAWLDAQPKQKEFAAFTKDECKYLADRLNGVNDETGQSILRKLLMSMEE